MIRLNQPYRKNLWNITVPTSIVERKVWFLVSMLPTLWNLICTVTCRLILGVFEEELALILDFWSGWVMTGSKAVCDLPGGTFVVTGPEVGTKKVRIKFFSVDNDLLKREVRLETIFLSGSFFEDKRHIK